MRYQRAPEDGSGSGGATPPAAADPGNATSANAGATAQPGESQGGENQGGENQGGEGSGDAGDSAGAEADPQPAPPRERPDGPTDAMVDAMRAHGAFHRELAALGPVLGFPGKLIELCEEAAEAFLHAAERLARA